MREKDNTRGDGDGRVAVGDGWRLDLGTCVAVTLRYCCRIGTASPESCDIYHMI